MKVKPLQDRILVERLQEEEKTKGGLFIPDSAKEKPMQGKIVAAGNGRITEDGKKIPMDVKVGDIVLFAKYSGNDVKIDDKEYLIMKEDDILAIVEK
ncbi:MAG: co-chaperone GroES [bacterium]|jgi:chaperonin GroES|nr:co-chaperone GroES [Deltaproteobacteria bacterium]